MGKRVLLPDADENFAAVGEDDCGCRATARRVGKAAVVGYRHHVAPRRQVVFVNPAGLQGHCPLLPSLDK
jgi:hypothetical protein